MKTNDPPGFNIRSTSLKSVSTSLICSTTQLLIIELKELSLKGRLSASDWHVTWNTSFFDACFKNSREISIPTSTLSSKSNFEKRPSPQPISRIGFSYEKSSNCLHSRLRIIARDKGINSRHLYKKSLFLYLMIEIPDYLFLPVANILIVSFIMRKSLKSE